jgi:hypothetical protein
MNRKDVIERAIEECITELYLRAQPSISLDELKKLYKKEPDKHWYDYFYLNQKEAEEIIEDYIIAYRIRNEFHDDMDTVRRYLRDGGTKDKYIKPKDGSPGYRGYENTPKLSDLIGEEAAQQALNLIDECDNFYQPNKEESGFKFNVLNLSPCCNIETVRKNRPDIAIYERKYYDEWDIWRDVDDNGNFINEKEIEEYD